MPVSPDALPKNINAEANPYLGNNLYRKIAGYLHREVCYKRLVSANYMITYDTYKCQDYSKNKGKLLPEHKKSGTIFHYYCGCRSIGRK